MLTNDEETKNRNLIEAVEEGGYDCLDRESLKGLTATLRIGRITTEISALDAQEQTRLAAKVTANQAADAELDALRAQKDAKREQLRALLGSPPQP